MKKSSLILIFFPLFLFGQESDFMLWSKASVNYSINKKANISFTQGLRLRENASLKDELYSNFSISRKWNKRWSVAMDYRLIEEYDVFFNSELQHRFSLDFSWRKKIDRLTIKSRSRFQYGSSLVFRERISAHYNLRKTPLEPSFLLESFYDFSTVTKLRATIGATYPLAKSTDIDLYYRLQNDFKNASLIYILGIGISQDI
ncbi:DUF2490 domain-containing protein [Flavobacteriales bacterium]|nr:DUF2490 domain-containing protein [Flavobacteriales bacterium]